MGPKRKGKRKAWRTAGCVLLVLILARILHEAKEGARRTGRQAPTIAEGSGGASGEEDAGGTDADPTPALIPAPADVLARLDEVVETRLREHMESEAVGKELCAGLDLPWPVRAPSRSHEEISVLADKEAQAVVDQRHPIVETTAKIRREAEAEYHLYQTGEQVSLVKRGGRGPFSHVSGRYVGRKGSQVRIGSTTVQLRDIDSKERVHFIEELSTQKTRAYVDAKLEELDRTRGDLKQQKLREVSDRLYRDSGYVSSHGRWEAGSELYAKAVESERKKQREALREEVYTAEGLVEQDGGWFTAPTPSAE